MLVQAAQQGDADALAFIARCFMGEEYVWAQAGFKADDANASKLMQKSAIKGSATGVLCAARSGNLTPSVEREMPFASFKEAFEEILWQAEGGDAFCCYMVGNVYYWGDYLRVDPSLAKQFKDTQEYNAWAYPIAREWYERSFDKGLCAGWGNYVNIRKSGLCDIPTDVYEKYYQLLADISPVICCNYGYYLRTDKGDSYGGLLRYMEAARKGDPTGAYNAGHVYEAGEEVEENIGLAYQLFEIAARGGARCRTVRDGLLPLRRLRQCRARLRSGFRLVRKGIRKSQMRGRHKSTVRGISRYMLSVRTRGRARRRGGFGVS